MGDFLGFFTHTLVTGWWYTPVATMLGVAFFIGIFNSCMEEAGGDRSFSAVLSRSLVATVFSSLFAIIWPIYLLFAILAIPLWAVGRAVLFIQDKIVALSAAQQSEEN